MNTATQAVKLPPMLLQYQDYKQKYPDCLLLFQVGDFYELFFEDAVTVSRTLNLTLTSRDKNNPDPIPMCGVPIGVVDAYLQRLVAAGYSAAIVSQSTAPQNGKGMVARHLERIVTPGISLLGNPNSDHGASIVAAVYYDLTNEGPDSSGSIAFSDAQTGKIFVRDNVPLRSLAQELSRIGPMEIILPSELEGKKIDRRSAWVREIEQKLRSTVLKFRADVSTARALSEIAGYAVLNTESKRSVKLLISYVDETTVSINLPFSEISTRAYDGTMSIDAVTRENLELLTGSKSRSKQGSLWAYMDCAVSAGGSRLIRQWLNSPLATLGPIVARHDAVRILREYVAARDEARTALKYVPDLERIAARIELSAVMPKELAALRDALENLPHVIRTINAALEESKSSLLCDLLKSLKYSSALLTSLRDALHENPAHNLEEGGVIREGFDEELDRLRGLKSDGKSWIAELEASERLRTGISSLKIKYNGVIGYFIEVTSANVTKVPSDYIRKGSTANSERFTIEILRARESEVVGAEEKQIALERELFEKLRVRLLDFSPEVRRLASALSEYDALLAFAELAEKEDLSCPEMDDSTTLVIEDGRHPILKRVLGSGFVANGLQLGGEAPTFAIITGPNMGGKSTFLRQAALIAIMAQVGSFVPARSAKIGIVDKIFARLGASDNLTEGDSTFLVEMREASHIVANATDRSLLLIDEIGRGTATADGLAIAQAILEWIVLDIGSRTLFATHFHELTQLADRHAGIVNLSVSSIENGSDVIFTHEICAGPADKSYGLEVAKLAGLPNAILDRASELLSDVLAQQSQKESQQLSMFKIPEGRKSAKVSQFPSTRNPPDYAALKVAEKRLQAVNVDDTTPREALRILSELQTMLRSKE